MFGKYLSKIGIRLRTALFSLVAVVMFSTTLLTQPASAKGEPLADDKICALEDAMILDGETAAVIIGYDLDENGRDFNCNDIQLVDGSVFKFKGTCKHSSWGRVCNQERNVVWDLSEYKKHMAQPWLSDEDECFYAKEWENNTPEFPVIPFNNECVIYDIDWDVDTPQWD